MPFSVTPRESAACCEIPSSVEVVTISAVRFEATRTTYSQSSAATNSACRAMTNCSGGMKALNAKRWRSPSLAME
jgi:hypothetical protein